MSSRMLPAVNMPVMGSGESKSTRGCKANLPLLMIRVEQEVPSGVGAPLPNVQLFGDRTIEVVITGFGEGGRSQSWPRRSAER